MCTAEIVQQLLVGRGFLQRVQVAAVQVLQQGVAKHRVVLCLPDNGRDRAQAGLLGGAPPSLPHYEFVATRADRPDDDRLQQADLSDRMH
jgi:hypothetical protein